MRIIVDIYYNIIEGYPYWTPLTYIGQDSIGSEITDYHFYHADFEPIITISANSYESVDSNKERMFVIRTFDGENEHKQLLNAENGSIRDVDYDYIKPYIAKNGVRVHTGIKYYRITSNTDFKDYYNPRWAMDSAEKQAGHFLDCRVKQIQELSQYMDVPPLIVSPYDAELYGHWWYEGPYWLYILFKKIYYDDCNFKLITPGEYIDQYPNIQVSSPCISSWGANGYSEVWLNSTNDYVHRHLHKAGDRMVELAHL